MSCYQDRLKDKEGSGSHPLMFWSTNFPAVVSRAHALAVQAEGQVCPSPGGPIKVNAREAGKEMGH